MKRGTPPEADELNQSWNEPNFQAPFVVGSDETVFLPGAAPAEWWIAVVGYDSENTFTVRDIDQRRDGRRPRGVGPRRFGFGHSAAGGRLR